MTFNQYIQNAMKVDKNPLMVTCTDKILVKDYITKKLGTDEHTIKTIESATSLKDLYRKIESNKNHPKNYFLKCNNDSGGTTYVQDHKTNGQKLRHIDSMRGRTYGGVANGEWFYAGIKYQCFTEEVIGENVVDYKWHCYKGKAKVCQMIGNRTSQTVEKLSDRNGKDLNFCVHYKPGNIFEKPQNWQQMAEIADILSEDFNYVRVDMYNIDGKIYIGELTFAPMAGRYIGEGQAKLGNLLFD